MQIRDTLAKLIALALYWQPYYHQSPGLSPRSMVRICNLMSFADCFGIWVTISVACNLCPKIRNHFPSCDIIQINNNGNLYYRIKTTLKLEIGTIEVILFIYKIKYQNILLNLIIIWKDRASRYHYVFF